MSELHVLLGGFFTKGTLAQQRENFPKPLAAIVTAWETAKEYVSKEIELRAEAKVLGQPRLLQVGEAC